MRFFLRLLAAIVICSLAVAAQAAPPIHRLPKNTTFFIAWNGMAAEEKGRTTNALLRLWADPEFQSVQHLLVDRVTREGKTATGMRAKEKELIDTFLDTASNPFIMGILNVPRATAAATSPAGKRNPIGLFLIYDRTGKTEVHAKMMKLDSEVRTEKPIITTSTFSGVTITQEETSKDSTFNAYFGNYYLTSDSKETIQALLTSLNGTGTDSITTTAAYQAALAQRAPGAIVEFFAQIPDLAKAELPSQPGVNFSAMLKSLHIERVQAVAASVGLAGNSTRLRAAILGDTAAGSAFDLFASGGAEFRTLAVAPAGASFSATRFDFHAFYKTLRSAMQAGLNPEQASQLEMMEGMGSAQLGMTISEAMQAISGEVATISLKSESAGSDSADSAEQYLQKNLYAVSTDYPDNVLKLIQLVGGKNITSETREGPATVLSIAWPYTDEKTGAQRKRFYYAGVLPNMVILASRRAQLREAIARVNGPLGPANGGLAGDPSFTKARSRLPGVLNGLAYSDLSTFPWQFLVDSLISQANKEESAKLTAQEEAIFRALPKVIQRYLHVNFGGAWKDRGGVFLESFIE